MNEKRDISSRGDIEILITSFYSKVRQDELLAPQFRDVNWDLHTPVIIDFWCMILLGNPDYKGNPFQKHMHMAIGQDHFEQWLNYFFQTVDEHFEGPVAEEAKVRARSIANIFQFKLGLT
jgi:hemoglobin